MDACLLRETPHFAALGLGSALIVCWKQSATVAALRDLETPARAMVSRHPEGIAWMAITGSDANPEEPDFSKESALQLQRFKAYVKAIACVQAGMTMRGTLVTVMFRVIGVLSKNVVPVGIYRTPGEACLWLHRRMVEQRIAGRMTLDDLCRGVQAAAVKYVPAS